MWKRKASKRKSKDRPSVVKLYPQTINVNKVSRPATVKKSNRPAKVFIYALSLAAIGGGGFLVYDKIRRRKLLSADGAVDTDASSTSYILPQSTATLTRRKSLSAADGFPLKRGSRGSRVTQLQQALFRTLPSIQIDGQFGPATAAALKAAGYSETVNETLFKKIVGSLETLQIVFNPSALALTLYKAAQGKNLAGVLSVLKQIKTSSDYSSVNEAYKKQAFISKTIVTDLLDYAFKDDAAAQDQIRHEFQRMGLKVDSAGTWSLQGIRLYKDLITIRATIVTDGMNNKIPVKRNTILGDEIKVSSGMTWFRSIDRSVLKVPTQDVKFT